MSIYEVSIYATIFLIRESIEFGTHGIEFKGYVLITSFFCSLKKKMFYKVRNTVYFAILISGTGWKPEAQGYRSEVRDIFTYDSYSTA
jgi:hypothetical protein